VNESEREIVPIKRLWAMGNFSRFIRPGFRRFEVEHDSTVLRAVGCKSPDGSRLVVVVMNTGMESEEVELHFEKGGGVNIFDAYETSEANDLKIVSRGVKNNRYNFPAETVTTLVIKESGIKRKRAHF
jgi:O-glycosyl hydrolase